MGPGGAGDVDCARAVCRVSGVVPAGLGNRPTPSGVGAIRIELIHEAPIARHIPFAVENALKTEECLMSAIKKLVRNTAEATVAPGVLTTAAVALAGRLEGENAVAPLNAVSHIPFGDEAFEQDEPTLKYTATGAALNLAAVASWAAVYEMTFGRAARRGNTLAGWLGGAAVAGLAYVTDYYVVPRRLTPGFEKRLSAPSMFGVYAVLAASLPLASLFVRSRNSR
jgi:hypothetical protein